MNKLSYQTKWGPTPSLIQLTASRKKIITEVISSLFIILFLYTALNKTLNIVSTVNVLRKTPILSNFPETSAWLVVILEYAIAILLFIPATKKIGLISSFIMMVLFSAFITYMKIFIPNLPCSCGGIIASLTWTQHLIFNIGFSLLAALAILLIRKE